MVDGASDESGFSLVELLVAMTITLIVSGAIYGLLAGGQNAFRREPELTERQQNIRMAMDLIMRDVGAAGVGMPPFVQVFAPLLDGPSGAPNGPNGILTDELEIVTNSGRDSEPVCPQVGGPVNSATLVRANVPVTAGSVVLLSTWDGHWTTRRVTAVTNGTAAVGSACIAGNHTVLTFGGDPLNPTAGGPCTPSGVAGFGGSAVDNANCAISAVNFADIVRYRVRADTDGVPVLQRSASSRRDAGFQTIARGIEDLQVVYATVVAPTVWVGSAPVVTAPANGPAYPTVPPSPAAANYGTLVRHVRVTLAARSEAQRIQGMQTSSSGGTALRGSLTSTGSPRSALFHVARGRPSSPAPSPGSWYWE